MDRKHIISIYNSGPDAVIGLVENLLSIIQSQAAQIQELTKNIDILKERIKLLEDQIAKDSHNSSKPPSSDKLRKKTIRSLRKCSNRTAGGQNGHKGSTLQMVDTPDRIVTHSVYQCQHCSCSLQGSEVIGYERRQEFDIPPLKIEVTEHRAEIKNCHYCGQRNKAVFPQEIQNTVQYGSRLKSLSVYLMQYQLLPYERTSEFVHDIFNHSLSQGTLYNTNKRCYEALETVEQEIKRHLKESPVVNFDETGLYCKGKRNWLHVSSTPEATYYIHHQRRGKEAMDEMNILPQFKGTAVHDYWKPYFKYSCKHALCNAHHLRELTFVHEQYNEQWAKKMIELLLKIKGTVQQTKPHADCLDKKTVKKFESKYNRITKEGLNVNSPSESEGQPNKRGRKKQSKSKNLLDRLKTSRKEALAFMYNFQVPFDNNLAERDIRMTKVQQKISGCFRSENGAKFFCRIRGYISTIRKHNINVLDAIQSAITCNPFVPQFMG